MRFLMIIIMIILVLLPIVFLSASGLLVDAGRRFKNAFEIDCQLSNS